MRISFLSMFAIEHGLARVNVVVNSRSLWITCFQHEFPNEEKGIEWLREQIEKHRPITIWGFGAVIYDPTSGRSSNVATS